jgi:lipid II:glycine glycyltransferase (peptidoglycan interpeptide bridge formation enzyme)
VSYQVIQPDAGAWDAFVEARGGHLLQTSCWGALKRAFGWHDQIVALAEGDRIVAGALLLTRRLPLVRASVAYVPRGPVADWTNQESLAALMEALDAVARANHAILLKLEPDERDTPDMGERLSGLGFRESAQTIQPPRTILVNITGSEDDILARMTQTTRRKVRAGAKKGIVVRRGGAGDLDSFNALVAITGGRNRFGVHSADYYRRAYELFAPDHAALIVASYQGIDLASLIAFALGKTAWYFYGASSNEERERMPTYAIQWEAIRWARERGCTAYDLWGIPDADEATLEAGFQRRSDGLWGVYGFKRGFGGEVVRSVGAWDRVYKPIPYAAYRLALAGRGMT